MRRSCDGLGQGFPSTVGARGKWPFSVEAGHQRSSVAERRVRRGLSVAERRVRRGLNRIRAIARRVWSMPGLVVFALLVGIAFFAGSLSSASIFDSFVRGGVSTLIVLGVGGLARSMLRGGEVEELAAPGGWRVKLAQATRRPLRTLERRVDTQMQQVNDRLYDLETRVFKDGGEDPNDRQ
jgi:hypothetical protein